MVTRIARGEHRTASPHVRVAWASRLVTSSKLLSLKEQRALLTLAADAPSGEL